MLLWVCAVRPDSLFSLRLCDVYFDWQAGSCEVAWQVKHQKPVPVFRTYRLSHPSYARFGKRFSACVYSRSLVSHQQSLLFEGVSSQALTEHVRTLLSRAGMDIEADPARGLSRASLYSLRRGAAQALDDSLIFLPKEERSAAVSHLLMHKSKGSQRPYLRRKGGVTIDIPASPPNPSPALPSGWW